MGRGEPGEVVGPAEPRTLGHPVPAGALLGGTWSTGDMQRLLVVSLRRNIPASLLIPCSKSASALPWQNPAGNPLARELGKCRRQASVPYSTKRNVLEVRGQRPAQVALKCFGCWGAQSPILQVDAAAVSLSAE